MLSANNYSDIQILQGSDFLYELEFAEEHNDADFADDETSKYEYKAKLAQDFTGATTFLYGGVPTLDLEFEIKKTNEVVITIELTAEQTGDLPDDFDGVWDVLEKKDLGDDEYEHTRQMQGDAVISAGVVQPADWVE